MGKVHIQIEFDSIDEMIREMGNQPMRGVITEEVPREPEQNRARGATRAEGERAAAEQRKRRAFLRHADGAVLETWDQSVVDDCLANGGQRITKQEFDVVDEPPTNPEPQPKPEPTVNEGSATFDDVRDVVKELNGMKGLDTVMDVLGEFGIARVSELDELKYAAFVARARELLNG